MSYDDNKHIDFALPDAIKDFIFDMHDATRRSLRVEDVQTLYDSKFKEITEKYFSQGSWPSAQTVASECGDDYVFLLFYRELTMRQYFSKLKQIPLNLYLESWSNYNRLFNILLSTQDPYFIKLTTQWAYDIVQEFVYQFQSFCQFRAQVGARSEEDLHTMEANKDAWSMPIVSNLLSSMIRMASGTAHDSVHSLVGYFCTIELGRLECLLADYTASLDAISGIRLSDQGEMFSQVPTCHVNIFYHAGVSMIMLRRYADAIDTFSHIILHISRVLKPGASVLKAGVQGQHQKMLDKMVSLAAIAMCLCPGHRVDDQVADTISSKCSDKLRRLRVGDIAAFEDMFESACPKFISPTVPDSAGGSTIHDAIRAQVHIFMTEAKQQMSLLHLRSYLRLYSSIELSKLARFNDVSEEELVALLLSSSHKNRQVRGCGGQLSLDSSAPAVGTSSAPSPVSDVSFRIQDGYLIIDHAKESGPSSTERFFLSGIRKNAEFATDLDRIFRPYNM
mmetsp:Transcript_12489/g.18870  ORF Transcript_12489/g.18870 Transcript_12489/m.18870 type:complete len:506 (+) Transcript_12489:79-1596(+)